jgi:hypothetical protein
MPSKSPVHLFSMVWRASASASDASNAYAAGAAARHAVRAQAASPFIGFIEGADESEQKILAELYEARTGAHGVRSTS